MPSHAGKPTILLQSLESAASVLKINDIFDPSVAAAFLTEILADVEDLETRHLFECAAAGGKQLSCRAYFDVGVLTRRPRRMAVNQQFTAMEVFTGAADKPWVRVRVVAATAPPDKESPSTFTLVSESPTHGHLPMNQDALNGDVFVFVTYK